MHAPSQTHTTLSHLFLPLAVDRTRRQPSLLPSLPSSFRKKNTDNTDSAGETGALIIKNLVVLFLLTYLPSSCLFPPWGKTTHTTHKGRRTTHTKKKSTFHTFIYALCWYVNDLSHSLSLLPACLVPGRAGPKVGRFTYTQAKLLPAAAARLPLPRSIPPSHYSLY